MGTEQIRARTWALVAWLAFLVVAVAGQESVCVLPTQIKPGSKVALGGDVLAPLQAPITPVTQGSLRGFIYVVFPSGKCPTAAELPDALKSAFISNPSQRPAVSTIPSELFAMVTDQFVGDLANLSISGFQMAISSPQGTNGFGSGKLEAAGIAGTGVVDADVLGVKLSVPLTNSKLFLTGCAVGAKGGSVIISCPQAKATMPLRRPDVTANLECRASLESAADLSQALLLPVKQVPGAAERLANARPPPPRPATRDATGKAVPTTVCVLPADIDPKASSVRLVGDVVTPIPAPVSAGPPAALDGFLYIMFPTATCPTAAQLPAALKQAFIVQPAGRPGTTMTPPSLKGAAVDPVVGKLADLELKDFKCEPTGSSIASNGSLTFACIGTNGTANTVSSILDKPLSIPQKGKQYQVSNCSVAATGPNVTIRCPSLVVRTTVEDKATGVYALLGLQGSMRAAGSLAAAKPTNVSAIFGAAKLLASLATPATASAPKPAPVAALPPTPPAASPVPTITAAPGDYSTLRNGGQARCQANSVQPNGNCACQNGWYGRGCPTCANDSVCRQLTGSIGSTCSNSMVYTDSTVYKAYNCSLLGGLASLVSQITVVCNVRGGWLPFEGGVLGMGAGALINGTRPADNRFCQMVVDQANQPDNPLVCTARKCSFTNGAADFSCATTTCNCPATGKCNDIVTAVVRNLATTPLQLACEPSGRCTVKGFNPQLVAQCSAGECTWPNTTALPLPGAPVELPAPFPTAAIVSAVPPMLLLLLAVLGGAYVFAQHSYFAASSSTAAAPAAGDLAPNSANSEQPKGVPFDASAALLAQSILAASAVRGKDAAMELTTASSVPKSTLERMGSVGIGAAAGATSMRRSRLPDEKLGLPLVFSFDNVYCAVPDNTKEGREAARAAAGKGGGAVTGSGGSELPVSVAAVVSPAAGSDPVLRNVYDAAGRRVLLHRVSGGACEGQVLGVMGPSGSGKTTLLSILSGSMESIARDSTVQGTISLGGETRATIRRKVTAYVPQKDVLLPSLTVEESIKYSALLRLPKDLPAEDIQARVNGVLEELGLLRTANSLVGGAGGIRGVSGGERRRVTIGMELVTAPKLVIMDEPTSGLDSYTAYNLMQTAHDIAAAGRVVLMSLHQPSPDMFGALDSILLLARGRLVYSGPPSGVTAHFARAGVPCPANRPAAEHMMAAVSVSSTLAALLHAAELQPQASLQAQLSRQRRDSEHGDASCRRRDQGALVAQGSVGAPGALMPQGSYHGMLVPQGSLRPQTSLGPFAIAEAYEEALGPFAVAEAHQEQLPSSYAVAMSPASVAGSSGQAEDATDAEALDADPAHANKDHMVAGSAAAMPPAAASAAEAAEAPLEQQSLAARLRYAMLSKAREFAVLFWRTFIDLRRSPGMLLLHVAVALLTGLVVGLVFFRLDTTNVGVQNRLGSMFFALSLFGFTSVTMIDSLVLERELAAREVRGRYYGTAAYLTAKLVLDGLLLRVLPAVLFTALMYPMVGLMAEATRVATFIFVLATYACTVGALSIAISALCRTAAATTLTMNIILLGWVLVGGFLVNPTYMPKWISWVRYLSPMSFALEALASNEMSDQFYDIVLAGFPNLGAIKGDSVLLTLGLDPYNTLRNVACLVGFYFGSVLLAVLLYALSMVTGGPLAAIRCAVAGVWRCGRQSMRKRRDTDTAKLS